MKPWYMHQFTAVFSNDLQICSLISKLGVDGSGLYEISYLAAIAVQWEINLSARCPVIKNSKISPCGHRGRQMLRQQRAGRNECACEMKSSDLLPDCLVNCRSPAAIRDSSCSFYD